MSAPHSGDPAFLRKYGPCAVVTGASDGIGRAMAIALAEAGFDLVIAARRRPALESLAAELAGRCRGAIEVVEVDLGTDAGIGGLIEATRERDVGLFVAAAGFGTSGSFAAGDLDADLNMIDVNCRAVTALAHVFARRFVARRRGGLVLLSSLVAFQGVPRAATYAATKAYVQSLAEALHVELRPLGVDVLSVAPGPVRSGFGRRAGMVMGLADPPEVIPRPVMRALGYKMTVRPGWLARALEASLATLPRRGRIGVMARVMQGMTGHQDGKGKGRKDGARPRGPGEDPQGRPA